MSPHGDPEQQSLLSNKTVMPDPDTVTKLIKRLRAMVIKLLPNQVELELITSATSSILTPAVVKSFAKAAGDFKEALPYALIVSRATFIRDANIHYDDYEENLGRAAACEMLARKIVHSLPASEIIDVISTRFRMREIDGDDSPPTSALEMAIDTDCREFLSSSESQDVVNALWTGDLIQINNDNDDIEYVKYHVRESGTFWSHINPARMGVPRYQNIFRQLVWVLFLFVYSKAVSAPLTTIDPEHSFDEWEWTLYILAASQMLEESVKLWKTIRLSSKPWQSIGFWTVVSIVTDGLLLSALYFRIMGIWTQNSDKSQQLQFKSFQILACAAPFIWIKIVTIFDGLKVIGMMQVVVFRMLRESAIFFILLAIMALGFVQSMIALDAADGKVDSVIPIVNMLIQALLGSPDFAAVMSGFGPPFGLIVYYAWCFLTLIILLNILIALFGSAYGDIEQDATNAFLCFFAFKTVGMVRAPDTFVYCAPFNLIEVLIAPLEFIVSKSMYTKINIWVMNVIFAPQLWLIAFYESQIRDKKRNFTSWLPDNNPEEDTDDTSNDPEVEDSEGRRICHTSFQELVKAFPNTSLDVQSAVIAELRILGEKIAELEKKLDKNNTTKE